MSNEDLLALVFNGYMNIKQAFKKAQLPNCLLRDYVAIYLNIKEDEAINLIQNHIDNGGSIEDFFKKTKLKKLKKELAL